MFYTYSRLLTLVLNHKSYGTFLLIFNYFLMGVWMNRTPCPLISWLGPGILLLNFNLWPTIEAAKSVARKWARSLLCIDIAQLAKGGQLRKKNSKYFLILHWDIFFSKLIGTSRFTLLEGKEGFLHFLRNLQQPCTSSLKQKSRYIP